MDPKARDFVSFSAYNYVVANPVNFIDPNGKAPKEPDGDKKNGGLTLSANGPFIGFINLGIYTTFSHKSDIPADDANYTSFNYLDNFTKYDEPSSMHQLSFKQISPNSSINNTYSIKAYHYKKNVDDVFHFGGGINEVSANFGKQVSGKLGGVSISAEGGAGAGLIITQPKIHGSDEEKAGLETSGFSKLSVNGYQLAGVGASTYLNVSADAPLITSKKSGNSLMFTATVSLQLHAHTTKKISVTDTNNGNVLYNSNYNAIGGGLVFGTTLSYTFN